ncbi:hypothetical protein Q7P37_009512 [Cladosporium fusiforme]
MSLPQPSSTGDDNGKHAPRDFAPNNGNNLLSSLASEIQAEIDDFQAGDKIYECGNAALAILKIRPSEALQLAKDHIQNTPYREVRPCWLRLYEDATLHRAAELLHEASGVPEGDWMSLLVRILDLGVIVSGATVRGELYEAIFANLETFVEKDGFEGPSSFNVAQPDLLQSEHLVPTARRPSLETFQIHINNRTTPLLLTGVIDEWPATQTWQDPTHLLRRTLGGRRCVPVEIGETYTHADWRQEIMPFHQFMHKYLLPDEPSEIGYLGQHNLFHQIPALLREIQTPDYCFSAPPETTPASRLGLPAVPPVDEPQKNVWLGPKGTRTPLHTDPYHNIFCQVFGYKYVRLYPPHASASVYPRGVDENGINESNTSQVELKFNRARLGNVDVQEAQGFPDFLAQSEYQEAVVGPGECLYIPAGWWHYIEALSASCSVSFWWN